MKLLFYCNSIPDWVSGRVPKKGQLVEVEVEPITTGRSMETFYVMPDYPLRDPSGGPVSIRYDQFREPEFTNAMTKELAYKQLYEDDKWREHLVVPKRERVFTTDAEF